MTFSRFAAVAAVGAAVAGYIVSWIDHHDQAAALFVIAIGVLHFSLKDSK